MQVPVYIDGMETGTLQVERRGQWTVIDVRVRDVGRVVRLTVYGERSYYLGVPVPDGDGLRLTRRLSPAEARRFPQTPRYAAERPVEASVQEHEPEPVVRRVLWLGGRPHYF